MTAAAGKEEKPAAPSEWSAREEQPAPQRIKKGRQGPDFPHRPVPAADDKIRGRRCKLHGKTTTQPAKRLIDEAPASCSQDGRSEIRGVGLVDESRLDCLRFLGLAGRKL